MTSVQTTSLCTLCLLPIYSPLHSTDKFGTNVSSYRRGIWVAEPVGLCRCFLLRRLQFGDKGGQLQGSSVKPPKGGAIGLGGAKAGGNI